MKFPHPVRTVRALVARLFTALEAIQGGQQAHTVQLQVVLAELAGARAAHTSDLQAQTADLQAEMTALKTAVDVLRAALQTEIENVRMTVGHTAHAVSLVHSHQLGHSSAEPARVPPVRIE